MLTRRGLLGKLIAAPAVVAAGSLMPVRSIERFSRTYLDDCGLSLWAGGFSIEEWVGKNGIWWHIVLVGRDDKIIPFVNGEMARPRGYEVAALKAWAGNRAI